ncbi:MAG: hypothetical protein KBT66_14375 [Amphritea sp.]|nr:hypothetical protein [Amphritea sp.]MBQ0785417.1 hypothetical protein [Amphritea sp.]
MQRPNTPKKISGSTRTYTDELSYLVNKRNALPELSKYIDALSLPLNAQNEEIYINAFSANATNGIGGVEFDIYRGIAEVRAIQLRQQELNIVD